MKFCFGDIVVVEEDLIGVVVKSFVKGITLVNEKGEEQESMPYHLVYVRSYNDIRKYTEDEMERYMVRHKYLNDEEKQYQENAIKGV